MSLIYCSECGNQISDSASKCPKCGKSLNAKIHNPHEKNKWIAFLLCFFFGALGVHKFYEGKVLFGIIYFFTIGLLGIGVLVDLILILLKPNPYCV